MVDVVQQNLGRNLTALRRQHGLSQATLAQRAGIPRSTVAHIESGHGNPSLANLARVSDALGVGIEELLARPRSECVLITARQVPVRTRSSGRVRLHDLLPERVRGLNIARLELDAGATMRGTPHVACTKEFLHGLQGCVHVLVAGTLYAVNAGDVLAFPGDQPHSYINRGESAATAVSVVVPLPLAAVR
jgi:XRE family transcriptional regulator, regulator of sulfur utilization